MAASLPVHSYEFAIPSSTNIYEETKQWMSEMVFYKDEIEFLSRLAQKFSLKKSDKEILMMLEGIADQQKKINGELFNHLGKIKLVDENSVSREVSNINVEHKDIASEVYSYAISMRLIKKQVFQLADTQLKSRKRNKQINDDYKDGGIAL